MARIVHEDGHITQTRAYGSDNVNNKVPVKPDEPLEVIAERSVVEKHGEQIKNNPNFKTMVEEEQRQIKENIDNTKGM